MAIICQKYAEVGLLSDNENILDVAISYNGTWQKRGHSSHNGAVVIIAILTVKQVLKCDKNDEGSANFMEQECANLLWQNYVEKYRLRYRTMLSDGASKICSFE